MNPKALMLSLPVNYSSLIESMDRAVPAWLSRNLYQRALQLLGPFYRELGISILVWSKSQCELKFRLRKRTLRMDESLNAGAVAGLGQVGAALLLLRNLDTQKYKFRLKELNVVVREAEFGSGVARLSKDKQIWDRNLRVLSEKSRAVFNLEATLLNGSEIVVATVRSQWLVETR